GQDDLEQAFLTLAERAGHTEEPNADQERQAS
ncbi:MAG: hypothetical protein QOD87_2098, partial [Pseudonocardiales bacterium]|nr:hypothetical protein [Pseudonocardiales bacterium]